MKIIDSLVLSAYVEHQLNSPEIFLIKWWVFLSWKYCVCFLTSAAYIQVYFKKDFIMEANTMNPDQTAPVGSGSI